MGELCGGEGREIGGVGGKGFSLWERLMRLLANGILLQAIGVPARHLLAAMGLVMCFTRGVGWRTYLFAFVLWPLSGLGVTAGAHRLWTHQSYKPKRAMEVLLLVMYSIADQGPIGGWALTHALHHRASDTVHDPHNRNAGFWHAHFGWLFSSQSFTVKPEDYTRIVGSFSNLVKMHDRCCMWWDPLWSLGMPALVASGWGEPKAGLMVAGALRWLLVQHVTFFVNSVAHGERDNECRHAFNSAARGIGPRVSLLVTLLALGEGWHDYHHHFPWDYAAAELDAWDQWNPTKVFIDICHFLGICEGRRRCSVDLQLAKRSKLLGEGAPTAYEVTGVPFLRYRVAAAAAT